MLSAVHLQKFDPGLAGHVKPPDRLTRQKQRAANGPALRPAFRNSSWVASLPGILCFCHRLDKILEAADMNGTPKTRSLRTGLSSTWRGRSSFEYQGDLSVKETSMANQSGSGKNARV